MGLFRDNEIIINNLLLCFVIIFNYTLGNLITVQDILNVTRIMCKLGS